MLDGNLAAIGTETRVPAACFIEDFDWLLSGKYPGGLREFRRFISAQFPNLNPG